MDIRIDFSFERHYLPTKQHRKERTDSVQSQVDVPIREVTAFPVAFIVKDYKSIQNGARSYEDFNDRSEFKILEEEIRVYEDKLYAPVRVTHGAAVSTVFEEPIEYLTRILTPSKPYIYEGLSDKPFTDESVVVSTTEDEARQSILDKASRYVLYDGIVWEQCEEPVYVINTFGLGHNHGGTGFFVDYCYNPNIPASNYFNALQRDEAIEYGKKVAAGRGDTESIPEFGNGKEIEVLMPEMVKRNPKAEHGSGDPFLNRMEDLISGSDNATEAGLLVMAATFKDLRKAR